VAQNANESLEEFQSLSINHLQRLPELESKKGVVSTSLGSAACASAERPLAAH
jgi:hypothetical protein